jgi:hypothetical protein
MKYNQKLTHEVLWNIVWIFKSIVCIFLYLLLYILKFLSKVVSVCRYFSTNRAVKYYLENKKHCNKLCFYSDFLKWGQFDPMLLLT